MDSLFPELLQGEKLAPGEELVWGGVGKSAFHPFILLFGIVVLVFVVPSVILLITDLDDPIIYSRNPRVTLMVGLLVILFAIGQTEFELANRKLAVVLTNQRLFFIRLRSKFRNAHNVTDIKAAEFTLQTKRTICEIFLKQEKSKLPFYRNVAFLPRVYGLRKLEHLKTILEQNYGVEVTLLKQSSRVVSTP